MTTLSTPLLSKRKPRRRTVPTHSQPPTQPQPQPQSQSQSEPPAQPGPTSARDQRHDRRHDRRQLIMTLRVVVLVVLTVFSLRAGVPGLAVLFLAAAALSLRGARP